MLPRDIKIHYPNPPTGLQNTPRVIHSRKPIGNHRERIRKRHDVHGLLRGESRDIRKAGFHIPPAMLLDAFLSHIEKRF